MTTPHYLSRRGYATPLPPAVELLSQEEMVKRIEAARLEAHRTCTTCGASKPLTAFVRHARAVLGREYCCVTCKAQRDQRNYVDRKRRQFRSVLGLVAS